MATITHTDPAEALLVRSNSLANCAARLEDGRFRLRDAVEDFSFAAANGELDEVAARICREASDRILSVVRAVDHLERHVHSRRQALIGVAFGTGTPEVTSA